MLAATSDALNELNRLELLPLVGVLIGLVWYQIQPSPRTAKARKAKEEAGK